ncbi:MAG: hypothetical protein EOM84_01180 [Sphingobacteriia bacterium]|jgi:hypothetical protein|nr:hypothetical protein [Sphingobacteriia bacterium]
MNKKITIISISLVALAIIFFGVWKWSSPKKITPPKSTLIQYKETSPESKKEITAWQKYENDKYHFQINYPNNWHIFTDEAKTDLTELTLQDNEIAKQGGTVFWSNEDNIDYTQENKPEDFLLLGMMVYEKTNTNLDDFAKLLGFTQELQSSSVIFKATNLEGKEYISLGATEKDPRVAIIFQKNNNFYVFHLGFIGDNQENLKVMEGIVGSLSLK